MLRQMKNISKSPFAKGDFLIAPFGKGEREIFGQTKLNPQRQKLT
jgi:hypothetical protein